MTESWNVGRENGPQSYRIGRRRRSIPSRQYIQTKGSPPSVQVTQTSGVYLFVLRRLEFTKDGGLKGDTQRAPSEELKSDKIPAEKKLLNGCVC